MCMLILASGIKCWDCRSDADPKCSDPFDNTTFAITDCKKLEPLSYLPGAYPTMCRKIRQKGKYIKMCNSNNYSVYSSAWCLEIY